MGFRFMAVCKRLTGERELADGMASVALADERRPRSGSRETALEVRCGRVGGLGGQGQGRG